MTDNRLISMHELAQRLNANGSLDQLTMRQIDTLAINANLTEMNSLEIQKLRQRENISQAVLATILNMSSESVQKWEQGKSKPTGAALRLLHIIQNKGIEAVI